MKQFMLDTNTVSFFIRGHPAVTRNMIAVPMAFICISAVTEGELIFGLAKRPEAKRLRIAVREFLQRIDVLAWDSAVAEHHGHTRASLERQGKSLAPLDLLIAAHAIGTNLTLVTHDQAFSHVTGLRLEDWTK